MYCNIVNYTNSSVQRNKKSCSKHTHTHLGSRTSDKILYICKWQGLFMLRTINICVGHFVIYLVNRDGLKDEKQIKLTHRDKTKLSHTNGISVACIFFCILRLDSTLSLFFLFSLRLKLKWIHYWKRDSTGTQGTPNRMHAISFIMHMSNACARTPVIILSIGIYPPDKQIKTVLNL